MAFGVDPKLSLSKINRYFKPDSITPPDFYLGTKIKKGDTSQCSISWGTKYIKLYQHGSKQYRKMVEGKTFKITNKMRNTNVHKLSTRAGCVTGIATQLC